MSFYAGMSGEFSGVKWRIVRGKKSEHDLRMEVRTEGWVPISMALAFLQADFYEQNETTLQEAGAIGRRRGKKAGERFLEFCRASQLVGWEVVVEQLRIERERRRAA